MGIILSGGKYVLDKTSEKRIIELADQSLKEKHASEYESLLEKFRDIVFLQETASFKRYLEHKHPEQVEQIHSLRAILNHERTS